MKFFSRQQRSCPIQAATRPGLMAPAVLAAVPAPGTATTCLLWAMALISSLRGTHPGNLVPAPQSREAAFHTAPVRRAPKYSHHIWTRGDGFTLSGTRGA